MIFVYRRPNKFRHSIVAEVAAFTDGDSPKTLPRVHPDPSPGRNQLKCERRCVEYAGSRFRSQALGL